MKKVFVYAIVIAVMLAVSLSGTVGIVWAICKLIGWTFSWKIAVAIWFALLLIGGGTTSK